MTHRICRDGGFRRRLIFALCRVVSLDKKLLLHMFFLNQCSMLRFKEWITLSCGYVAIQRIKCITWSTFYRLDRDLPRHWIELSALSKTGSRYILLPLIHFILWIATSPLDKVISTLWTTWARCINGYWQKLLGSPCNESSSHPLGLVLLLVASCSETRQCLAWTEWPNEGGYHWLRKWRELYQSIIERSKSKPKQTRNYSWLSIQKALYGALEICVGLASWHYGEEIALNWFLLSLW